MAVSPSSWTDKNLYAYCDNNPVTRADSSGQIWHVAIGAIIGGAFEIGAQLLANGGKLNEIHWGKVAVAATVGGITAATGVLVGAVVAGAGNGLMEKMSGTNNTSKIITSVVAGAGASFLGSASGLISSKIGGKMAIKSLSKTSPGVIKKTILSKVNVRGADRNAIKNLSWAVNKYRNLPSALFGKNIPQVFNSLVAGISGYGIMGAIYGFK